MNDKTKLERIRELALSKVLEVQPLAGEEMNLPQSDPHRDGFINGERTLAAQVLALIDEERWENFEVEDPADLAGSRH